MNFENKLNTSNVTKEIIEPYGKVKVIKGIPCIKLIDQSLSRQLVSEAMILYGDLISTQERVYFIAHDDGFGQELHAWSTGEWLGYWIQLVS